jgi:4-diphosphocytidyl-2-C-methyl-D-erythritol kinase
MTVRVRCPAKINLFLSVGPKDGRGYHPIRTVFQAISLSDWMTISDETASFAFESNVSLPEDNTVTKALRLVAEAVNVPPLRITLEKNIPAESGLGGGSSDAAGLLRCISRFVQAPIADGLLRDIAFAVGADVPFFLVGGRAAAEGYGEKLTPLPALPLTHLVVARPEVGCATAEAYRRLDARPYEWRELSVDSFYNDFERVAPCECLHLKELLLSLGAADALLCGSGSAVFGVFPSAELAQAASQSLDVQSWSCHTITHEESVRI